MATTRYIVAATATHPAKTMSNLKSARREADLRAKGDRTDVTVTTEATNRLTYTAKGTPTVDAEAFGAALAEVVAERETTPTPATPVAPADDTLDCGCKVGDIIANGVHGRACKDAADRKAAAKAVERDQPARAPRPRTGGGGRREAQGASAVEGWELLYDKPKQNAQVGRSADGKYALICTTHQHAHPLNRLVQERGLRQGKRSVWCPQCTA
jgi:hypothetical protein